MPTTKREVLQVPVDPARMEALRRSGAIEKLERLGRMAQDIASSRQQFYQKAGALMGVATRISQTLAPHVPCRQGCNHCCYMGVAMSEYEANRIGKAIGRAPAKAGMDMRTYAMTWGGGAVEKYAGLPCPMLGADGNCSVYGDRPYACRTHHNLAANSDNCKIVGMQDGRPVATTPMINVDQFLVAHVMVFAQAGQRMADIREWFPEQKQEGKK